MDFTRSGLRARDLAALGIDRSRQLSSERVRSERGICVPQYVDEDPDLRAIVTAVAVMGPHNALGGWAALAFQGVRYFEASTYGPEAMVHCLPGSQLRPRALVRPFHGWVRPEELIQTEEIKSATIARAAFDEMRTARSLEAAVVVADMAVSRITEGGRTSIAALRHVIDSHHKVRGIVRARQAVDLAIDRSASPWETRLRMKAVRDLRMKVVANPPIFDLSGNLLGIADLLEPSTGVVLESDGAHHRDVQTHRDDNIREEAFEHAGLVVARFSAEDHAQPAQVVRRIDAAKRRARREMIRGWTLEPPPWWQSWEPGRRYRA